MATKPTLTLAALDKLDGAAAVEPFTFGIKNKVITFPDPFDMDATETEAFMEDIQGLTTPMAIFKRWLSPGDFEVIVDSHLTGRQATVLLREANRHYEALLGGQGKEQSSTTA